MKELFTDRLHLRPFRLEDFNAYAEICADPEVMTHLGGPLARPDAWRNMAMHLGHWALRGFGHWAVVERASGRVIGRLGFFEPEGWPGFELGWVLGRPSWGSGYAIEGARAALPWAFGELGRAHVISLIRPENTRSIRVAERLGETPEGSTELFGHTVTIWSIRAAARG